MSLQGLAISNQFCVVVKGTKIGCSFLPTADVILHTIILFATSHYSDTAKKLLNIPRS
jgi:hypothetical protein